MLKHLLQISKTLIKLAEVNVPITDMFNKTMQNVSKPRQDLTNASLKQSTKPITAPALKGNTFTTNKSGKSVVNPVNALPIGSIANASA